MSEDEKGFLARWSQRKSEAGKAEPKTVASDETSQPAERAPQVTAGETEPALDPACLPKLEEITARTDMTVFFRKGVPESMRNAALRKAWALDPAIRDYINPALDYAYDWNAPGGAPGSGELAPDTDIARMVSQVMGEGAPQRARATMETATPAKTDARDQPADHGAGHHADGTQPGSSVRLSQAPPALVGDDAASDDNGAARAADQAPARVEPEAAPRTFASQQAARRHGSARPK